MSSGEKCVLVVFEGVGANVGHLVDDLGDWATEGSERLDPVAVMAAEIIAPDWLASLLHYNPIDLFQHHTKVFMMLNGLASNSIRPTSPPPSLSSRLYVNKRDLPRLSTLHEL